MMAFNYPIVLVLSMSRTDQISGSRDSEGSDQRPDTTALPSVHFHLDDEYRELDETTAKVELQERTKELGAITRANELFGEVGSARSTSPSTTSSKSLLKCSESFRVAESPVRWIISRNLSSPVRRTSTSVGC